MNLKPNFEFINFEPRESIRPMTSHWLNVILDAAPSGSSYSATITLKEGTFLFKIVIRSLHGVFSSKRSINPSQCDYLSREWQADTIFNMHQELMNQYKKCHKNRESML